MGQKANTTILQISTNNTENLQKYQSSNIEECALYLNKTAKILPYVKKSFEDQNYWLNIIKVTYTQKHLNIFLSLYKPLKSIESKKTKDLTVIKNVATQNLLVNLNLYNENKTVNIKIQNLNKQLSAKIRDNYIKYDLKNTLIKLKPFLKNKDFQEYLHALIVITSTKPSSNLINKLITTFLTNNKKQHNFFLSFIKKVLTLLINTQFSVIKGVKIIISGRLNGRPRARKTILEIGNVPQQSIEKETDYSEGVAYTKNGTFGVKSWISYL